MALTYPLNKWKTWAKVPGKTHHLKWNRLVDTYGELASEVLRRIVLADASAFKVDPRSLNPSAQDHEVDVLLTAKYFTSVRNVGRGQPKDRREFDSFSKAVGDANGDRQALVYGVVSSTNTACLSRMYWPFYIAVLAAIAERG